MASFRRKTESLLRKRRPDVVVGQYTSALGGFRAAPDAKRVLLYPIAHHDWMSSSLSVEAESNPEWATFLQGARLSEDRRRILDDEISLATDIIVPSSFARETFLESGVDGRRVHVMSLGAEADAALSGVAEALRSVKERRSGPLRVLFAGQVNQRKGISYLLDAVAQLGEEAVTLQLAGPSSHAIRAKIQGSHPATVFLGTMPRRRLMSVMAEADVLVLPSLAEGFGLVALESMLVGTPVVVTSETFAEDIITADRDGWIVRSRSAHEIANVLWSLSSDRELLLSVSSRARSTAQGFGWSRYEAEIESFLSQS